MKRPFLFVLLLVAVSFAMLPLAASAQTLVPGVDPAVQQVITEALPAKYTSYGTAIILGIMILGRFFKAMADGRGIRGWISAIINGTKIILLTALCLLTLTSCSLTPAERHDLELRATQIALTTASGAAQGYAQSGSSGAKAGAANAVAKALQPPAKQPSDVQP